MAIGSPALLYVDWPVPRQIIHVKKDYMAVVQLTPTEIRSLNTIILHEDLRDLCDDEEGIPYLDTHNFVGPITVGGVALAQVVEIINGYTLTFEENLPAGSPPCPVPYGVNLLGSNNNIADITNVNSVSVRSSNSAGLTYSKQVEDSAFEDARVWQDTVRGTTNSQYPTGTPGQPAKTNANVLGIISARSLPKRIHLIGTTVVPSSIDASLFNVRGESPTQAFIHFITQVGSPQQTGSPVDKVNIENAVFNTVHVGGYVYGEAFFDTCDIDDLFGFFGEAINCGLGGIITIGNDNAQNSFVGCHSNVAGSGTPTVDCNDKIAIDLTFRAYAGGIRIVNYSDAGNSCTIDLISGHAKIDPTCTAGVIVVRGTGHITDNSGPGCTVITDGLVEGDAGGRSFGGM